MKTSTLFRALLLSTALTLAACGDKPTTDINSMIENGQATQAIEALESQLAANPTEPTLLALALKAHLMACAEADCPETGPDMLQTIAGYAAQVKQPVALSETLTLTPETLFHDAALKLANLPTAPASLLKLYEAAPESMRPSVMEAAFTAPLIHLRKGKTAIAAGQLQALGNAAPLADAHKAWARLAYGLLTQQETPAASALATLHAQPATATLPESALRLLPYLFMANNNDNLSQAAQNGPEMLKEWNFKFLTNTTFAPAASELAHMRANADILERLSGKRPHSQLTSATTVFDAPAIAELHLMRLSLAMYPANQDLWETFLPLAAKAQQASADVQLLAGQGAPPQPPAVFMADYVATLFRLLDVEAARDGDMLPLLTQLGSLKLDKPTQVKLEKLVQDGLENAAEAHHIPQLLALAAFKPEVARNTKQTILPPLVEAIRADLQSGNTDRAVQTATLINDDLEIDFNFEALLMKELESALRTNGTLDKLSADEPDALLQDATTATLDLGNLWEFITTYLVDKPAALDHQLKSMVASAKGMYGTPTALYRLSAHFPESTFPPEARTKYLNKAITQSVLDDARTTGPELADLAWRLSRIHTTLPLAPLLEEALTRATSLEDSRSLWQKAPASIRRTMASVRPTYTSLMNGIDAWEAGRISAAASAFAELDSSYAEQVSPYLLQLRDKLTEVNGLYVATQGSETIPTALINVTAPALSGKGTLADLTLTFTNRLGTATVTNPKTLTTDHAAIRQATLPATMDFATFSTDLDPAAKAATGTGFDDTFGPLTKLSWAGGTLTATMADGSTATFTRLTANSASTLAPEGDYLVTQQTSKANQATDLILPAGSLLSVQTASYPTKVITAAGEDLGTAHPLTATLKHPGMKKAEEVKGYYNPATRTFALSFTPPLLKGGEAKANLICQTLGPTLLCGANHSHANREKFIHQVMALQTRESAEKQAESFATETARQHKIWQTLTAAQLLQGNETPEEPQPETMPTTPTNPTANSQTLLPPPDFLTSSTTPSPTTTAISPTQTTTPSTTPH